MSNPTPTAADSAAPTPAWLNLDAVLPEPLRTDIATLVAEAEALKLQMHDFAVRCARGVNEFYTAALEADRDQGLGNEGLLLVEKYGGYTRLLDLLDSISDCLSITRLEARCDDLMSSNTADDEL